MSTLRTLAVTSVAAALIAAVALSLGPAPVAANAEDAVSEPTGQAAALARIDELKARYRFLDGVTIAFGATPDGSQAVAYHTKGHIVIDPAHTARIEDILDHEIWHVIDCRDNGRIDWGESVPPRNATDYLK